MLTICQEIMDQIIAHAKKEYPNEACGLLVGSPGQNTTSETVVCENIYDERHAQWPDEYPRTARTAYLIDTREQQRIFTEAEKNGMEVKAIWHSHTDHDAYFSDEDRLVAAPWGEPMFPGISYVVISIWNKKFKEANEFYWDDRKGDFVVKRVA